MGVARVQHGRAVHGPEHRQVLQTHLRGPVLSDGDPRVRADEVDAGATDRGHPDEVVGPGQEGRERRGVRHPAARREADRGGDELLFGDVALEEPVRVLLGEGLGAGGVAHLAVEGDDVLAGGTESGQGLAVGVTGRHALLAVLPLPAGQHEGPVGTECSMRASSRPGNADPQVTDAAQLLDRLVGVGQRLAVQPLAVLDGPDALALEGAGEDRGGLPQGGGRLAVGAVDGVHVVSVDLDRVPAEGLEAAGVGAEVVAVPGGTALAEAVDVDDHREVVEVFVARVLGGLPHRALGELAVPAHHPHAVADAVQPLPGQRDADAHRKTLAERAGGRLDPRQPLRGGVSLQPAAEFAEGQQLLVVDGPGGLVGRVQQGEAWPFERTKRSLPGCAGRSKS